MIQETIKNLEKAIEASAGMDTMQKAKMQDLVRTLKDELESIVHEDPDSVHTVLDYASLTTREVNRLQADSTLLEHSMTGLALSVKKFEISHPKLTAAVNAVCTSLANMGI
jgi:hypothetical protein